MLPWQVWLIIAGVCLVIEIATVGFLVFWFAVAALITAILSLFIHNVIAQTAIFILTSVVLIFLTKPLTDKISKKDKNITNLNTVIGKDAIVTKEINTTVGTVGQVKVSGEVWSAVSENYDGLITIGSTVKVLKIDGVKLVIEPIDIKSKNEVTK